MCETVKLPSDQSLYGDPLDLVLAVSIGTDGPRDQVCLEPWGRGACPAKDWGGWQRGCLLAGGLFSCQACRNLAFLNRRGNTNQPHKQNLYKNIRLEFTLQFTFSIRGRTIFFSFKSFLSFPTILNGWNRERHQ